MDAIRKVFAEAKGDGFMDKARITETFNKIQSIYQFVGNAMNKIGLGFRSDTTVHKKLG